MRTPIGVTALQTETGETLVVVCDDGTVWQRNSTGQWIEGHRIPGTEREAERMQARRIPR